jgi:cation:H+ antiporter
VLSEGRALKLRSAELEHEASEVQGGRGRALLIAAIGLAAVYGGAWLLVDGGVRILSRTGLTAGFVGAAIVGTLASLDEVLLEVLPVVRGTPDLATGNLFGTIAAFSSIVLGLAALVHPLVVDSAANMSFLAAASMYGLVGVVFLLRGRIGKPTALVLLVGYVAWLGYTATL